MDKDEASRRCGTHTQSSSLSAMDKDEASENETKVETFSPTSVSPTQQQGTRRARTRRRWRRLLHGSRVRHTHTPFSLPACLQISISISHTHTHTCIHTQHRRSNIHASLRLPPSFPPSLPPSLHPSPSPPPPPSPSPSPCPSPSPSASSPSLSLRTAGQRLGHRRPRTGPLRPHTHTHTHQVIGTDRHSESLAAYVCPSHHRHSRSEKAGQNNRKLGLPGSELRLRAGGGGRRRWRPAVGTHAGEGTRGGGRAGRARGGGRGRAGRARRTRLLGR